MMHWKAILVIFIFLQGCNDIKVNNNCKIITYSSSQSKKFIGSPSFLILPNGNYIASHDLFGPNSNAYKSPKTFIFNSNDKGKTWKRISVIKPLLWGGYLWMILIYI